MSLRSAPGRAKPGYPQSATESPQPSAVSHSDRAARRRVLERAYPLAKELAEVLELEAIEPAATTVKRIRQSIGAELAEHGSMDPHRLDPAEGDALTRQALALEDELVEVDDGR